MTLEHSLADMAKNPALLKRAPLAPVVQDKAIKDAASTRDLKLKDRTVSMSNALARGTHSLTLAQKRLIALALTKTDAWTEGEWERVQARGWEVTITAKEYAEAYDVSFDTAYGQMKLTARALMRTLWHTREVVKVGNKNCLAEVEGPWLTLGTYIVDEGQVRIVLHSRIAGHLLELRSNVTRYKLKQATALRSVYAWRLMECLKSWKGTGKWVVSVEEFAEAMDAPPSAREKYWNLLQKVINPAIKDLREKGGMDVKMTVVGKLGKKVTRLMFEYDEIPLPPVPAPKKRAPKKAKGQVVPDNLELNLEQAQEESDYSHDGGEAIYEDEDRRDLF